MRHDIDLAHQALTNALYGALVKNLERRARAAGITPETAGEWQLRTWVEEPSAENGFTRKLCGTIARRDAEVDATLCAYPCPRVGGEGA